CLIDYKTKGTDRDGRVQSLDPKAVTQLGAGLKAAESRVDADAGTSEPWAYGGADLLLGVPVGGPGVVPVQAVPAVAEQRWYKFGALPRRRSPETARGAGGPARRPVPPAPLREQA